MPKKKVVPILREVRKGFKRSRYPCLSLWSDTHDVDSAVERDVSAQRKSLVGRY